MSKTQSTNLAVFSASDLQKIPKKLQFLSAEQLQMILKRTPPSQIKKRAGRGGQVWSYVNGAYCTKMLNMVFGFDWDFKILKHEYDLNIGQAFVLGELTVRIGGHTITKQQFGRVEIKFLNEYHNDPKTGKQIKTKTNNPVDLGNDLKAASTDALKKCATSLGFFSDVYHSEDYKHIEIVADKDKEAAILEKELAPLRVHLQRCENMEDVEKVQYAYESGMNGELKKEAADLIDEYKLKFKKK